MLYTTYEAVRGSLGVTSEDCSDSVIVESNLELELEVDLDTWLPTHATIYEDGMAEVATASEHRLANTLLLYAQWFCAYELAGRLLLYPQIVTDGKAQINRFTMDLERAQQLAGTRMAKYKAVLNETVNGASTSLQSAVVMAVSVPDYDPVTNV